MTTAPPNRAATTPGQTYPPRLIAPLVALNAGLLHTYLTEGFAYAETILTAMSVNEKAILKTAIAAGRLSMNKAETLLKNKSVVIDAKSTLDQTRLICEALQNLSLIGDIVFAHIDKGTIINDRLCAHIITTSRLHNGS